MNHYILKIYKSGYYVITIIYGFKNNNTDYISIGAGAIDETTSSGDLRIKAIPNTNNVWKAFEFTWHLSIYTESNTFINITTTHTLMDGRNYSLIMVKLLFPL